MYEQALIALRALSFLSLDLQHQLAELGGVKLIIDICTDEQLFRSCNTFSEEANCQAQLLTVGKKLICQAALASADVSSSILLSFPALSLPTPSSHYPAYLVNLATPTGTWIANELIASGSVWPDHTPFPVGAKVSWTAVYVTQVSDAGHLWCQFCVEKGKANPRVLAMNESLRKLVSSIRH